jgi:hypothetical protein
MPTLFNVNLANSGLGLGVRSVRCWFWISPRDKAVEVTAQQAHYVECDAFTANNGGGTNLGHSSCDTGDLTAMAAFKATTAAELLAAAYG